MSQQPPYGEPPGNPGPSSGMPQGPSSSWQPPQPPWPPPQGQPQYPSPPYQQHTADGQEFNQVFVPGIGDPPNSSSLAPGGKTAGSIIFEIPAAAKVQWVRCDPTPYVRGDLYFDA